MRTIRFGLIAIIAVAVLISALAGCGRKGLINVNGQKLTKDEFYLKLERVPVQTIKGGKQVAIPAGQYVIEQMIIEQLLTQLAKKEGVEATDEQIAAKLKYIKTSTGGNFLAQLKQQGMSEQDWKRQMALQQTVVNLIGKGSKVTDADVKREYDLELNKPNSQFKKPEAVFISVIMTETQAKADKAYKLLQDGQDFGSVALQLSEDKVTAPGQGRVGWVSKNMDVVPQAIRDAAFATGAGKYTKPFKVTDKASTAWIILRADSKRPASTDRYEDVKEMIKEQMSMKAADRKPFEEMLKKFMADSKITVNAERYKSVPEMMKKNAGVAADLAGGNKANAGAEK
ncbi:MAG: peptidyl-prolyl cis-trans isomerase [Armatimonadota bacterium]|jgi:DNA polymerase III delta prime subunit